MGKKHQHNQGCLFLFLRNHINQCITIDTISGTIITGTLILYTRKVIRLKDTHILSAGGETLFLDYITQKICALTAWGIPVGAPPPFLKEQIVTGQITDSNTHDPIVGALIKVVLVRDDESLRVVGYTYSGCDGYYMFSFSRSILLPNDRIQIQIVGSADSGK